MVESARAEGILTQRQIDRKADRQTAISGACLFKTREQRRREERRRGGERRREERREERRTCLYPAINGNWQKDGITSPHAADRERKINK